MTNDITSKWQTVAIVGFTGSVNPYDENRAAHGAVTLLQARRAGDKILGRRVNSNGRHSETSNSFVLSDDEIKNWKAIARCSS